MGLPVSQAQDVEPPPKKVQDGQRYDVKGQNPPKLRVVDRGKRAHKPEDDLRQFFIRVGDELEQGDERRKESANKHSRKHKRHSGPPAAGCENEDDAQRKHSEPNGKNLDENHPAGEKNGQGRTKPRAVRDPQRIGRGQGILEQPLKNGAGYAQTGAYHGRCHNPGQPNLQNHADRHTIQCLPAWPELSRQDFQDLQRANIVRANHQRGKSNAHRNQDQGGPKAGAKASGCVAVIQKAPLKGIP